MLEVTDPLAAVGGQHLSDEDTQPPACWPLVSRCPWLHTVSLHHLTPVQGTEEAARSGGRGPREGAVSATLWNALHQGAGGWRAGLRLQFGSCPCTTSSQGRGLPLEPGLWVPDTGPALTHGRQGTHQHVTLGCLSPAL